jgi:hypothetical protein|tara:strand:- start:92 stop:307 length:216 start_codon:yes stop_codon:yes gene_type:complete
MAVQDYFDTDMGEQTIDVSASTHKFQTSIVVKQDPNKGGILTFLEKVNNEPSTLPPRRRSQTVRPRRQGAY